jgi:hypothetical protein
MQTKGVPTTVLAGITLALGLSLLFNSYLLVNLIDLKKQNRIFQSQADIASERAKYADLNLSDSGLPKQNQDSVKSSQSVSSPK